MKAGEDPRKDHLNDGHHQQEEGDKPYKAPGGVGTGTSSDPNKNDGRNDPSGGEKADRGKE